jgi:hypothetical protein
MEGYSPWWVFGKRAARCIAICMLLSCRLKEAGLTASPVNHSARSVTSGPAEIRGLLV